MFVEYGFLLGEIIPEDFKDVYVWILRILVFASLVDTTFVGQLGLVELAAVGVSIALFNQVSRITIFPFVSFTTSFVAEEDTIGILDSELEVSKSVEMGSIVNGETKKLIPTGFGERPYDSEMHSSGHDTPKFEHKRHIPSASTALVVGGIFGLIQVIFLTSGAKPILNFMEVHSDSPMLTPTQEYLSLRSLSAPSALLSLAMKGIFR